MRSLALTALLGSLVASTSLVAQSLTEHAAAAAGATIGTAAGKPLGTALGNVFGDVDKSTSKAGTAKPAKTAKARSDQTHARRLARATASTPVAPQPRRVGGGRRDATGRGGGGGGGSSHHSARRRERVVPLKPYPLAPATPIIAPVVAEPVIKEHHRRGLASIKVGATPASCARRSVRPNPR